MHFDFTLNNVSFALSGSHIFEILKVKCKSDLINHEITRLKIYEKYIKVDTLEVAKLFSVTNDIEKVARHEKMNNFFFCIERGKF